MRIKYKYLPTDLKQNYNINKIRNEDGNVYCKIIKGMYELKQAARLAYEPLVANLNSHGYSSSQYARNIWHHQTRKTKFGLCVDNFGVKYFFSQDDIHHFLQALRTYYEVTIDWTGSDYCSMNIEWNYDKGWVDISMPNYITKAFTIWNHAKPKKPQHAPHKWSIPIYGKNVQLVPRPDKTEPLD